MNAPVQGERPLTPDVLDRIIAKTEVTEAFKRGELSRLVAQLMVQRIDGGRA